MSILKHSSLSTLFVSATLGFFSGPLHADVISPDVAADIQEPPGTYATDAPMLINMTARTIIGAGPCVVDNYVGCTLKDVLNDINYKDDFKPEIKVHFSADDYPDDGTISNAELRQRGASTRRAPQKSFRIKLDKSTPLWRAQRRIQLIKSAYDNTRVRNKLSYDMFADIPHLPSMRSQFVHLNIIDQGITSDYGLYTHVEHFGKEYLQRRGWDKDSPVYKTTLFVFQKDPALALDASGKPLDLKAFERVLEIKRGKNHTSLIKLIDDINNPALDFKTQVFDKYFNQDNYLTWFAVNILVNNQDTEAHNYYLFNPKNTEKFYIVPWDYDSTWGHNLFEVPLERLPRWWFSEANWYGNLLHKKFLKIPGNLDLLKAAVLEVKNKYFTKAQIEAKRDAYYDLVFPIITSSPDWDFIDVYANTNPERIALYNQYFDDLSKNIDFNYARFMERADDPMPFNMLDPVFAPNHDIIFSWQKSDSLSNQSIVYDLDIATDREFKPGTVVDSIKGINGTTHTLRWTHPKGTYYFRVISRDAANPQQHWQHALNEGLFYNNGWLELFGVKQMVVTQDGGTLPPPGTEISNPVSTINIDGDASEWNSLKLFKNDPDDIVNSNTDVIDWQNASIAHNSQNIYMLYRNRGPVNPASSSGQSIPWGWQTFLDTDKNPNTGFNIAAGFGADYLLEGKELLKYAGNGSGWNWNRVGSATLSFKNNLVELGFPKNLLGNPQSMNVMYQGDNYAYNGTKLDVFPDSGYFSYVLSNVPPPANQAPIAINQNLSVIKNSTASINLTATDPDGDSLLLNITKQPTHGTLTPVGTGLSVQYTPNQNYTGTDSFQYKVNDGALDSNIATVSLNVINTPPVNTISNPVVSGGITVNGQRADWNSLTLFSNDPDDIAANKTIDWQQAGIAHSNDTVYLMYQNRGNVVSTQTTGSHLEWEWQTFLDTDNDPATGYQLNSTLGADYILEGSQVLKYTGTGSNWSWLDIGTATTRYNNSVAELSFPRSLLGSHSTVNVAFIGNNQPYDDVSTDFYPESGSFKYFFGAGTFGRSTPVSSNQRGITTSPVSHQPILNAGGNTQNGSSGGGSFSWPVLWLVSITSSLLLIRRRKIILDE